MSKIEKALEKAKETRENAGKKSAQDSAFEEALPVSTPERIYSHTKVIDLEKEHLEKYRLLTLLGDPMAMDFYNLLRTQILNRTRTQGHNTIMITSALENEGKTTTAVNLAASIAMEEKQTVLLVDTDLRNPKIQHLLGCKPGKGLADYFQEDVPVEELFINPGMKNMVVLPGGRPLPGSTDIMGSTKMEKLVAEMKHRYPERYVIFDSPPLLIVPDALVFSSYVDGVILVVESGKTSKAQIRKAIEMLEGINIIGLVLNKGDKTRMASYYYYH